MIRGVLGVLYPDAAIIAHEVHDRLMECRNMERSECMELYYQLQHWLIIYEDWEVQGLFIVGRNDAEVSSIKEALEPKVKQGTFNLAWNGLLECGVVEVTEEGIVLPFLAGKVDTVEKWLFSMAARYKSMQGSPAFSLN